ncbi:ABC transporter substrate-binding protein [Plastorhodobacter daqingensis]|uniref:ABC transporter substrate-binding protein n=1 Tax=Plastorhodobacter daqingensis TaxID=1387281 RepID=A0ABW2UH53_9RHOB
MAQARTTRRAAMAGLVSVMAMPRLGAAQGTAPAMAFGEQIVARLDRALVTGGGGLPAAMRSHFAEDADAAVIAQSVLGVVAQTAEPQQLRRFASLWLGHMSATAAERLMPLAGGRVRLQGVQPVRRFHEVTALAEGAGLRLTLRWHVSDRSGRMRFFNLLMGQVNLIAQGREEVAALLAQGGGDLDTLIRRLGG